MLVSTPLPGQAADIERTVRRFGLEGIVAKRRHSRYQPGARSDDWQKVRFSPRQEFVVGGFLPKDDTFDALLVGAYSSAGKFQYAGLVRLGFSPRNRAGLAFRLKLASSRAVSCPFADVPHQLPYRRRHPWDQRITCEDVGRFRWLAPSEVIEVSFFGWDRHRLLLRQGRFLGIREDKVALAVRY